MGTAQARTARARVFVTFVRSYESFGDAVARILIRGAAVETTILRGLHETRDTQADTVVLTVSRPSMKPGDPLALRLETLSEAKVKILHVTVCQK